MLILLLAIIIFLLIADGDIKRWGFTIIFFIVGLVGMYLLKENPFTSFLVLLAIGCGFFYYYNNKDKQKQ